jgi:peptidyl-prolyl cis-trans isomerase SurA
MNNALQDFKKGNRDLKALEEKYNKTNALQLRTEQGLFEKRDRDFLAKVDWKAGEYKFDHQGRQFAVVVQKIEPARTKEFNETRGLLISDYQTELEKRWIEELRTKYKFSINTTEFDKLVK